MDNGGQNITNYRIDIWNRDEYAMENFVLVDYVGSNVLTYTIENLDNDTEYRLIINYNGYRFFLNERI